MKKEEIQALKFPKVNLKLLYERYPNRFLLSVAVAKRARQLKEGARPFVNFVPNEPFNPIAIAMKELIEKKVDINIAEETDEYSSMLDELDANLDEQLSNEAEEKSDKDDKKKDKRKSKSLAA